MDRPVSSDKLPKHVFFNFSEDHYLAEYEDVREAVRRGDFPDGFSHYLRHGVDENRNPQLNREAIDPQGNLETCYLSESGCMALVGWLADEGCGTGKWLLSTKDFQLEIPKELVFRFARPDVEADNRRPSFDYGFLTLMPSPSATLLQQKIDFRVETAFGGFEARATPDLVADQRLIDILIDRLATAVTYRGAPAALHEFLAGPAGRILTSLFRRHVGSLVSARYLESFRARRVERSFIVPLVDSADPILMQPLLFERNRIGPAEWIYVCSSRGSAEAALRFARLIAEICDVMITVVVMSEDVGFSAAANVGVFASHSSAVYIISPDAYPLADHNETLRAALAAPPLRDRLVGGLLFHDRANLAQSGLYLERDVFVGGNAFAAGVKSRAGVVKLARLERLHAGTRFEPSHWRAAMAVPAVSKRFMAFDRSRFESLGGFSSDYIYDGYEDADLALRWAGKIAPPVVHPGLRLALLETAPRQAFAEIYRSALMINRHLFSLRYNAAFDADPGMMTAMREEG